MLNIIEKYTVLASESIRDAIKKMDIEGVHFLVVINLDKKVAGVFTSGDFRKAVLTGLEIKENVLKIANKNYLHLNKGYTKEEATRLFENEMINELPVLHNGYLIDIVHRKNFYGTDADSDISRIKELSVVIMAGGKGTRLNSFTRILPKPLIPLGNDPVIKVIMDEFRKFGMDDFYISLNDKGRMVKAYFQDYDLDYHIEYIEEDKPLGTAGSLKFLEGKMKESFFVTNCDIIIKNDYVDILKFHHEGQYALTLVGSMQQYTIPYGICDIENGGDLKGLREKPQYDFLANTGLYIIEPDVLSFIPQETYFDMTDLIGKVKAEGKKVGVFPISEKSWIDVGQWTEYQKTIKELEL